MTSITLRKIREVIRITSISAHLYFFQSAGLSQVSADSLKYSPSLKHVDISDNLFTSIPSGLFNGLSGLSEVRVFNIEWNCDCSSLWWVEYTLDNNITMMGDFVCSNVAGMSRVDTILVSYN